VAAKTFCKGKIVKIAAKIKNKPKKGSLANNFNFILL
jgi:hypothetical protein